MKLCSFWNLRDGCLAIAYASVGIAMFWIAIFGWQVAILNDCNNNIASISNDVEPCERMPNACPCNEDVGMYKYSEALTAIFVIQMICIVAIIILCLSSFPLLFGIYKSSKRWFWPWLISAVVCILCFGIYCLAWWFSGILRGYWIFLTLLSLVSKIALIYGFLCMCAYFKRIPAKKPKFYYEFLPTNAALPSNMYFKEISQNEPLVVMFDRRGTPPNEKKVMAENKQRQFFSDPRNHHYIGSYPNETEDNCLTKASVNPLQELIDYENEPSLNVSRISGTPPSVKKTSTIVFEETIPSSGNTFTQNCKKDTIHNDDMVFDETPNNYINLEGNIIQPIVAEKNCDKSMKETFVCSFDMDQFKADPARIKSKANEFNIQSETAADSYANGNIDSIHVNPSSSQQMIIDTNLSTSVENDIVRDRQNFQQDIPDSLKVHISSEESGSVNNSVQTDEKYGNPQDSGCQTVWGGVRPQDILASPLDVLSKRDTTYKSKDKNKKQKLKIEHKIKQINEKEDIEKNTKNRHRRHRSYSSDSSDNEAGKDHRRRKRSPRPDYRKHRDHGHEIEPTVIDHHHHRSSGRWHDKYRRRHHSSDHEHNVRKKERRTDVENNQGNIRTKHRTSYEETCNNQDYQRKKVLAHESKVRQEKLNLESQHTAHVDNRYKVPILVENQVPNDPFQIPYSSRINCSNDFLNNHHHNTHELDIRNVQLGAKRGSSSIASSMAFQRHIKNGFQIPQQIIIPPGKNDVQIESDYLMKIQNITG